MKKIFVSIFTCATILLCVGLSYAYFTGMIFGEGKKLSVTSANLRILFTDSQELSNLEIEPGWSESKTFSVKNESDDNFNYNIVFENLVNTFVTEGFLQYKITSTNGYNMTGYLDIPKSNTPTDVVLAYDIDIPVDVKQEYTIEFIYHDSTTVDQSEDMGKILEGTLAIVEGTVNPDIKYTVTMNSDNGVITPTSGETIKKGNLEFNVTPNTGYDVNTMSVSCDPVANTVITGNVIKVNDIRQNHNCTVSFDKETYRVNIVVNNGKSDALDKLVEYGGNASATITPDYGYTVEGATTEGPCSIEGDILTISNVQSNGTCTVTLPRDKYQVTLTGTGIASSSSPQEAEYEGSATIEFTLSEGYELGDNVINCDNGNPSISRNVLTVSNVTANTTCTLSPILKSYDVTLKVNGGTPTSETKSVTHNGSTTYTIAKSTGYKLEVNGSITCTGNASGSLSGSTVTISGVTTTQTCTVNLKKETRTLTISKTGSGTIYPSNTTVSYGDNLTVNVTPATGYRYSSNTCGLTVSNNQMTFTNITENINCSVVFTQLTYTAKVNVTNGKVGSSTTSSKIVAYNGSTTFTITPNSGYTLTGATISPTSGCSLNTSTGVLTMSSMKANRTCSVTLIKTVLLADAIHTAYGTPTSGRPSFSTIDNGDPALYKGVDDDGPTYYFSGDGSTMKNWVKFADKWWRIIRINGNGSVRLLYAGDGNRGSTSNNYNGVGSTGKSAFNSTYNDPMYVGWKYGTTGSLANNRTNGNKSTIYGVVESWYNGLGSTNQNYIDTGAIYCNDRNLASGYEYKTDATFYYAAYTRLNTNKAPIFTCSTSSDIFGASQSGNNKTIPVGLMTADEVVAAGGLWNTDSPKAYYYLNTKASDGSTTCTGSSGDPCSITGSSYWWTMSPFLYSIGGHPGVFYVLGTSNPGQLSLAYVNYSSGVVRPVVSLKSNTLVLGSGTASDPYVVQGLQ